MVDLESLGEVITTDVLVVGGGIGGLITAIKAKENPVKVLIVEKQTTGWSGKAPKTGGFLWVMMPQDDIDKFVEYHVKHMGIYLEDQELLRAYAQETRGAIDEITEWGVQVARDKEGKLDTFYYLSDKWSAVGISLNMNIQLRKKARKMGVKIMNKIQVVDLLKQDDRVVGAVGFNIIDKKFYIFNAKSTILANGGCNYVVTKMWSAGRGDGIAAAYRAGAEMRNAEYANWTEIRYKANLNEAIHSMYAIRNKNGELLAEKYNFPEGEPDESISALLAMEKEVMEGRGPIYIDQSLMHYDKILLEHNMKNKNWRKLEWVKGSLVYNFAKDLNHGKVGDKPEGTPSFVGELTPIKVDHNMRTTLTGLWAVGDTSWAGSGWIGARPPPGGLRGSGLMNAILSSLRGGSSAGIYASKAELLDPDLAQVERFKKQMFAPLDLTNGVKPKEILYEIQDVVTPFKYQIRRSKDRLEEALSKIEYIKRKLPNLSAKDGHGLLNVNEIKSMTLCAEMTFRAALMRTETRGWHVREDYPERDDKNWLKWVIVKQKDGKMITSTEPIPIDKYEIKP
ncbi:MAG: FAD-dependent oxidoreductase [Promethearchaeota archaeon]